MNTQYVIISIRQLEQFNRYRRDALRIFVAPKMIRYIIVILIAFVFFFELLPNAGFAQDSPKWGEWTRWGDHGDGTYRNPVLPSDYSDIDCIRVGDDYYAISSTFQYSPGMIILHSKDLVNWTIKGHAVSDLRQIGKELNWDRMNRYGRGIWAGAIRYHNEKFYLYFGTPDEGLFMTTASDPAGPWEPLHCMKSEQGWDDCCPFFDDDGKAYFVATHFAGGYKTYLYQMTPDGKSLIEDSKVLINEGKGREANKLYKFNGTYYHFFSEVSDGRYVMMQRASSITGPYTERKRLSHTQRNFHEPNQGGIIEGPDGKWYFLTHHGDGYWAGRIASLLPINWVDDWPIIGTPDKDNIGTMVWQTAKPSDRYPIQTPQSSDDFSKPSLGPQWEWNYQPRNEMWSLTDRPGHLRLKAFRPLKNDDLFKAGNTLTQRCFATTDNEVILKIDLAGMADGQRSGLCHYAGSFAMLGVCRNDGQRRLEFHSGQERITGPDLTDDSIWLKSTWGLDGKLEFFFSTDGRDFKSFGKTYQLGWGHYRGDRIGIYCFNNDSESGYVDVDEFIYRYKSDATNKNYMEILSDKDFTTPKGFDEKKPDVQYGEVKNIRYYSTTTENERDATIILPPNFDENKKYPVLYLLHGLGGNEREWLGGNPNEVIFNLVAKGKSKEMIVVIPNIRARHKSVTKEPGFFSVEHFQEFDRFLDDLRDDLMPYIEKNYPVLPGRDNRAVAGLSMGGRSALHVGIKLIDEFAYIGALTPAVGVLPYNVEKGLFTKESLTLPDKYKKSTLIMIVKGEQDGVVGDWPKSYSDALKNNDVEHIYYAIEGGHDFGVWKNGLYNFARRLFQ